MQPALRAGYPGTQPGSRNAEQGWRNNEHHGWPPQRQPQHHWQARKREAGQVQQPNEPTHLRGHPDRTTDHRQAWRDLLAPPAAARVTRGHLELRVVGWSTDHGDCVTAFDECIGQFARVLPDARQLGREVHAQQDDFHTRFAARRGWFRPVIGVLIAPWHGLQGAR